MLLESITLNNFRQYYGKQTIYFAKPSSSSSQHITVIHGENGAGKTALLNAFIWCLYNKKNFAGDKLLSERRLLEMQEGENTDCSVTVRFRHNNSKYSVTRSQTCRRLSSNQSAEIKYVPIDENLLYVEYIDETGKTVKPQNPQTVINRIMPESMSSYFFFDGERIDKLSKDESADDIRTAIKTIMGLEILERASTHINRVQRRFREELKKYGTPQTQHSIDQLSALEQEVAGKKDDIGHLIDNQKAIDIQMQKINDRLKDLEGAKELQEKREKIEQERSTVNNEIGKLNADISTLCSERGHLAFANTAIQKTKDILDRKRSKGEIPSGIKLQFVEDLLERRLCICGQELGIGTKHRAAVEQWRNKAGTNELESSFIEITANVKTLNNERDRLFVDLRHLLGIKENLLTQLKTLAEQLDEIGDTFEKGSEELGELERRRKELLINRSDIDQKIGGIKEQIKQHEKDIAKLEAEIKKGEDTNEKMSLARRRMEACEETGDVIAKVLSLQDESVREQLQTRLSEVYSTLLRKGYSLELDENYSINVYKPFGTGKTLVDMSQGERQVTSLSFIGALVDIARRQGDKGSKLELFRESIIPIVMDSPFGQLDVDHRERISEGIHGLAEQIVIIVSSSQWHGAVEGKMKQYVGREYELNYFGSSEDHFEYTEVKEVRTHDTES